MEHILHATDLVMDYSTQQATPNATHMLALNHVDFGIQAGESIAVMGPSGSGKSTLLHALAGIITPTAGNVMFRGANLARLSDADRTKLRRSAFGFDTAMLWLERLGLRQLAQQRPGEMSGGQMQRIAIARALAAQPAVIFADEPTGALDQTTGHEIMSILMRTARQTGAAVVVVTHDSNVAAFCDATVTMRDGRLSSPQQSQPTAGGAR